MEESRFPVGSSASSNEGFTLSDGVNLVVTTSMMADRNGRIYPDGVHPDTPIAHGEGEPGDPDDAVVEAAKAWLAAQPGCAAAGLSCLQTALSSG